MKAKMELENYFETNNVYLEVSEAFDEYRAEGKAKKTALNAVRRDLNEAYQDEEDMLIQLHMGLYWCGLQKGFIDEKSKNVLEALTAETIQAQFDESDGRFIYEMLCKLLKAEPVKQARKKIDYSNPGAYNWKAGDIYAYELTGEEAESAGIKGKYALVYVIENEIISKRESDVTCYLMLKQTDGIEGDELKIIEESIFLPHNIFYGYRCLIKDKNYEYPTARLHYVGNVFPIKTPDRENLPKSKYYCWWIGWEDIEQRIVLTYGVYKKLFES